MLLFFKKYLASFLLILLFLGLASFALAKDLEIVYPAVGNLAPPKTTQTLLPDYVRYIFNLTIALSGLIVFAVIFYSGFRLITEADNPAAMAEAKTKITDAFIGLIILLGAYLLLATLNPQLVLINPEIKGGNQGIILYTMLPTEANFKAAENQKTITISQNLKDFPNAQFYQFATDPNFIKAWVDSNMELVGQGCFQQACPLNPSSPQSIKIEYQFPGVYLCKADGSCYFTSRSFNEFPREIIKDYEDQITYVKFKNAYAYDPGIPQSECTSAKNRQWFPDQKTCGYTSLKFGAILHEATNYEWTCDAFLSDGPVCKNLPGTPSCQPGGAKKATNYFPGDGVSSVTVFIQPNEPPDPTKGGVTLYKLENYSEEQVQSGGTAKKVFYNFPYSSDLNKYKDLSQYFYDDGKSVEDRVLSLKIDGNYLALLFKNPNFQHNCEVVAANDFNLGVDNPVGKEVSSLKVIPAQK